MVEDTNYYKLENAIKNINLLKVDNNEENIEEKIKRQFNLEAKTRINFGNDYVSLSYEGHKFEEYFLEVENDFNCSQIVYSRIPYKEEFLGYKFYCNDKIIILSKELNRYSSDFIFHEVNTNNNKDQNNDSKNDKTDNNKNNKDINKAINNDKKKIDNKNNDCKNNGDNENNDDYYYNFVKTNLFDKIDYKDYNIKGYLFYVYFYIYSLYKNNKKEKELKNNNIFIKIVDDKIDDYIINHINISKREIINLKDYIYIYMLTIKEHCAVLINFNDSYFLFDSSYCFVYNLENIFKELGEKVIILNKYKIQNLGTCAFHSMIFIKVFISSILKDKKNFIADLYNNINSYEFFFEYINQLNKFCGGKDLIFEKNEGKDYFSFGNKVYMNKNAYQINIINFNELFNFLSVNELNKVSLLLKKENLIYLKECKINYLKNKVGRLINIKYNKIDTKKDIFYNEEIASFTKKTRVLDEKQIQNILDKILTILKYKKDIVTKINEVDLRNKIKENIKFDFKEEYLYQLNDCFNVKNLEEKDSKEDDSKEKDSKEKDSKEEDSKEEDSKEKDSKKKDSKKKDINDIIIESIKKNKKDEYFDDECYYYLTKDDLLKKTNFQIINTIMKSIETFNSQGRKKEEIEKMLENLDSFKFELDYILSKLEGFINDIQ